MGSFVILTKYYSDLESDEEAGRMLIMRRGISVALLCIGAEALSLGPADQGVTGGCSRYGQK